MTPLTQLGTALRTAVPHARFRLYVRANHLVCLLYSPHRTDIDLAIRTSCKRETLALARTLPNWRHSTWIVKELPA